MKGDEGLSTRVAQEWASGNAIAVPPVVLYEIRRWLLFNKSGNRSQTFENFLADSLTEDMELSAFEIAATEHARLKRAGYTLDDADLLIAGFCLDKGYVLVTNNTKHYSLVDGLDIEDWTATV
ncbi:MAG: PIN domain-containing protein [Clostridiales bacterium]|nr:PIN domain-containing protein [Clostridiales bacterium]